MPNISENGKNLSTNFVRSMDIPCMQSATIHDCTILMPDNIARRSCILKLTSSFRQKLLKSPSIFQNRNPPPETSLKLLGIRSSLSIFGHYVVQDYSILGIERRYRYGRCDNVSMILVCSSLLIDTVAHYKSSSHQLMLRCFPRLGHPAIYCDAMVTTCSNHPTNEPETCNN